MSWATYTISPDILRGLAPGDSELIDGSAQIDARMVEAAKALVVRKVLKKGAELVLSLGGKTEFFDAVAAKAVPAGELEHEVAQMMGYAYLHIRAQGESMGMGHHQSVNADYYMMQLDESVMAFCAIAPNAVVELDVPSATSKTVSVSSHAVWDI